MKKIKKEILFSMYLSLPFICIIYNIVNSNDFTVFYLAICIVSAFILGCIFFNIFSLFYKNKLYSKKYKNFDLQELDRLIDEYDFLIKEKEEQYKKLKYNKK